MDNAKLAIIQIQFKPHLARFNFLAPTIKKLGFKYSFFIAGSLSIANCFGVGSIGRFSKLAYEANFFKLFISF